jgi:hypothetical protein
MAAVMALVFVPAFAAVLILGGANSDLSVGSVAAGIMFIALTTGMLAGLFRLARVWDGDEPTRH